MVSPLDKKEEKCSNYIIHLREKPEALSILKHTIIMKLLIFFLRDIPPLF